MSKQNKPANDFEAGLVDYLIKHFDTMPPDLKIKLADALLSKLLTVWSDEAFKDWDFAMDDLRKTGWK